MASIRKRNGKWQVQVRRSGCAPQSRTFIQRSDGLAWARQAEIDAERATIPALTGTNIKGLTLADIAKRYRDEIVPKKRGIESRSNETISLNAFLKTKLAKTALSAVGAAHFAAYRDYRLRSVKTSTLRREFNILRHMYEVAIKDWHLPIENPLIKVRLPANPQARDRRLEDGEAERLAEALRASCLPYLQPIVMLAVETGMRRGELLSLTWRSINLDAATAHLPVTKNGHSRTVPLTPKAVSILADLKPSDSHKHPMVFTISANAVRLAWDRIKARAEISDLHLHDLRREAVSRFFELGLSTPEVAAISGHRDYRMLARYTHLRPTDIAAKLSRLNPA